jgi:hypothetical protein
MSAYKPRRLDVVARKALVPVGQRDKVDAFDAGVAEFARKQMAEITLSSSPRRSPAYDAVATGSRAGEAATAVRAGRKASAR